MGQKTRKRNAECLSDVIVLAASRVVLKRETPWDNPEDKVWDDV
jgi:hypothetical protein